MPQWEFTKGLHQVKKGVYAYLCPDGSWGFNNAGLIVDGDASLPVDTLLDLASTQQMLEAVKGYWEYLSAEARKSYDGGMPALEAVADISMADYSSLTDPERVVVNVNTLYREYSGDATAPNFVELFGSMAQLGLRVKENR